MLPGVRVTKDIGELELVPVVGCDERARLIASANVGLAVFCDGEIADSTVLAGVNAQGAKDELAAAERQNVGFENAQRA